MVEHSKRLEILQKVANGELTIDESSIQLEALEQYDEEKIIEDHVKIDTKERESYTPPVKWKNWWLIPVGIFSFLTVIAATLLATSYSHNQFGVGFWFALVFLLLAIGGLVLSAMSSRSRWMHLRIHQKPGDKPEYIHLSFPVPFKLARWALHSFGNKMSGKMSAQEMEETLNAFDHSISENEPMHIEVDDKDGTHVEIFIG